jgi:hypothetical protein
MQTQQGMHPCLGYLRVLSLPIQQVKTWNQRADKNLKNDQQINNKFHFWIHTVKPCIPAVKPWFKAAVKQFYTHRTSVF